MKNYGKVDCLVEVGDRLPFLKRENRIINFELSARMWEHIIKMSKYFKPLLMEHLEDDNSAVEALYPAKRKYYINNYIEGGGWTPSPSDSASDSASDSDSDSASKYIMWTPVEIAPGASDSTSDSGSTTSSTSTGTGSTGESDDNLGVIKEVALTYPYRSFYLPNSDVCTAGNDNYNAKSCDNLRGATWFNAFYEAQAAPNDLDKIVKSKAWAARIIGDLPDNHQLSDAEVNEQDKKLPKLGYAYQSKALDGLMYCIESEHFLSENMPFWLNLKRTKASPTGLEHETLIIISIGIGSGADSGSESESGDSDTPTEKSAEGGVAQEYDLILRNNSKPELIDYWWGRNGDKKGALETNDTVSDSEESGGEQSAEIPEVNRTIFSKDLSKILREKEDIEIGFMTVAGRLVIFVNDVPLIYTRLNPHTGKLMEAKIADAKIRVYGTNSQMAINASAMTFAPLAACAFSIPSLRDIKGEPLQDGDGNDLKYQRVNEFDVFSDEPLIYLPAELTSKIRPLFGCDCYMYKDINGEVGAGGEIKGFGFHQDGYVMFQKAGPAPRSADGGESGFDYWVLQLAPWNMKTGKKGWDITNGGTPYFFRVRGSAKIEEEKEPEWEDISEDTISISQDDSLENDYTMNVKKLDLTLYNKGGKYDYLRDEQRAIKVSWSWCDDADYVTTFTGLTLSASIIENPGKELINVRCQDTTWVLKQMPIINSPYFDGMYSYAAIEYLLKMAGIFDFVVINPIKDAYFLPSGYGINDPKVKYPPEKTLFDCIQDIAQRDQSHFYFDGEGQAHLYRIPGGLFFDTGGLAVDAEFTRNPNNPGNKLVILDEKSVEYRNTSTVNQIRILTVDRSTRVPIFYMVNADSAGLNPAPNPNALLFRKTYYRYYAALGGKASAKLHAHDLGKRMFYPIMGTSFSVVGFDGQLELKTIAYIQIDGDSFRVTSVKRTYSADTNDYKTEITAEWLFGTQPGFGG